MALFSISALAADAGWVELPLRGVEKATEYEWIKEEGVWRATANCSASALIIGLNSVDLEKTPRLRWRWRVLESFENSTEREKTGDDFAARVSVFFRNRSHSFFEAARHRILKSLHGQSVPDRTLIFVWAHSEATGASWPNPYAPEESRIEVAESGLGSPAWRVEVVDIATQLRNAFGDVPRDPVGLGILTDSDNLCQNAKAEYADFEFLPSPRTEDPVGSSSHPLGR